MPFPSAALTAGNLTSLRRDSWAGRQYISLLPNTTIQTTTIAVTPPLTTTYAQLTLAATVSADVEIGHTVLVSTDSTVNAAMDIKTVFRVRRTPSGTTLYISESDVDLPAATTWYVHILDDYRIQPKIGRVTSAGTYYKDYDWVFGKVRPLVTGIQSAYAGFISGGSLQISFAPTGTAMADGATISSWLWDVGDGTITVGTATSQNITATFPEGFRWVTVTVTDSNTRTGWRRIPVWAHGSTFTTATGFTGADIIGNWDNGYSASVSAFDGVDSYIDETLVCIWRQEYYGTTEENIVNNIDFVGRLRNEQNIASGSAEHGVYVDDVPFTVEGPGQLLQRIPGPIIGMKDTASPTIWDEIKTLTPSRAIAHILKEHSTFCELHDLTFTDIFDDELQFISIGTPQSDMLSVVNDVAQSVYNAKLEFAPDGAARVSEDGRLRFSSPRPLTWASLDEQDLLQVTLSKDHVKRFAKVEASGGSYNTTSQTITPRIVTAPGAIGTSGVQTGRLDRQILKRNTGGYFDLYFRAALYLDALNTAYTISAALPDGYHWLIPSRYIVYDVGLDATTNIRGYTLSGTSEWLCTGISYSHDNETGSRAVRAEFTEFEADTREAPDPVDFPTSGPDADAMNGNIVCVWTLSRGVWVTRDFKNSDNPTWYNITPEGLTDSIYNCAWSLNSPRLYMLTFGSGSSTVWYKENGLNIYEPWVQGDSISGLYQLLVPGTTDGYLYISNYNGTPRSSYSIDSGVTLATPQTYGTGGTQGFDVNRIQGGAIIGDTNQVGLATTGGGAYSTYTTHSDSVTKGLFIPRYEFGSTTTSNTNSTPDYLLTVLNSPYVQKITSGGATSTDITPNDGTNDGQPIGLTNPTIVMPWVSGNKIAGFLVFGITEKLVTSTDAGSNWTISTPSFSGTTNDYMMQMRRSDTKAQELYMIAKGYPHYSGDFGTTITAKSTPDDSGVVQGIAVFG